MSQSGGAEVLRAVDRERNLVVALKVYRISDAARRNELLSEVEVLLRLPPHPGLPTVRFDFFSEDRYVIVMDWVEGRSLAEVLDEDGDAGLPHGVVVDYISQTAGILDHLHRHHPPIVHGDVKPSNLILTPDGSIVLVDFGISTIGGATKRAGTARYVAPEIAAGAPLTSAADVYGLAATAVALLTGRPPEGGSLVLEGIDQVEIAPLARTLRRGLATDPARRPASAGELSERLRSGRHAALPTGVVTFLLTEVSESGQLWDSHRQVMPRVHSRLDEILTEVVEGHGGRIVKSMGEADRTSSAFSEASSAAIAARLLQQRVSEERWPEDIALALRAALHSGESEIVDGEYQGPTVIRAGHLRSLAPAGRTIVSQASFDLLRDHAPAGAEFVDLGTYGMHGLRSEKVYGLVDAAAGAFPLEDQGSPGDERPPVWLLCADIQGSTELFRQSSERYKALMDRYRRVLEETATQNQGSVFLMDNDVAVLVLTGPAQAAAAAIAAHVAFAQPDGDVGPIDARIGIHVEPAARPSSLGAPITTHGAVSVCRAGHAGQILVSEPAYATLVSALPPGASLSSVGAHRLADLAQPQRLFQLSHPDLTGDFPPPWSIDHRPHNLPVQLTRFIGRRAELDQLSELIASNLVCTVTGAGGVGKTRLALQAAARVLPFFADGVWVVDLSSVEDNELVAAAANAAIGAREGGSGTFAAPSMLAARSTSDRFVGYFEHRCALIVLDNCDGLFPACRQIVDELLRRCPGVKVLATSTQTLGSEGEATYRLAPLELPVPGAPVEVVRQSAAVRLFVDRALLRRAGLHLEDDAIEVIASICRRVDGIPFAIDLAASWVNVLALRQIDERYETAGMLDEQGETSGGGRTLRAIIGCSYEMLSERERQLLRRLSVFGGNFSLDAAQHVCSPVGFEPAETLRLLAELVHKSLVETEVDLLANRYRLLQATRQYAAARLDEAEASAIAASHLAWYLSFAGQAAAGLAGGEQPQWLDRIEAEYENLRIAYDAGRQAGDGDDVLLAARLSQFWLVRGRLSEGRSWLNEALASASSCTDKARAMALCASGLLACFAGDLRGSAVLTRDALAAARHLSDRGLEARALSILGLVAVGQGRLDEAERRGVAAVAAGREVEDDWATSFALTNLGNPLALRGATVEARARYEESLAIRRDRQDLYGLTWALFRLGTLSTWEGRLDEATALLREALGYSERLGYGQGALLALIGLGEALLVNGDHFGAHHWFEGALQTAGDLEEASGKCIVLAGLTRVAAAQGNLDAARQGLTAQEAVRPDLSLPTMAAFLRSRAAVRDRGRRHARRCGGPSWRAPCASPNGRRPRRGRAVRAARPLLRAQQRSGAGRHLDRGGSHRPTAHRAARAAV